jgi:DNA-binding transcriptional LysR family regulator
VTQNPADLASYQSIIYEQKQGGPTWNFRKANTECAVTLAGRVHVNAAAGVREGVLAGLGFAIASEWMFPSELAAGSVVSVLDDWLLPEVELCAIFPTGRQASAKGRTFVRFIERHLSNGHDLPNEVAH